MNLKISQGEKLFLDRRQKGLTQPKMALALGIDCYKYRELEQKGHLDDTVKDITQNVCRGDYCTLIRRRLGLSQEEIAEKLGTTRYIVNRMELSRMTNTDLYSLIRKLAKEGR